ncbi:DUF402 domain-containing protein [Streptomyces sp. NPDC058655]|uniref:DUF402 domain-containing protein n=1 Tax=Streptomyces sp. NPDC058655 TaxID=3346577 RepID=UPI003665D013
MKARDRARLRNWYVNFEHPTTRRTTAGFDTLDLTVDLVVTPDLTRWEWKDEDEYAHLRRLGVVSDTEYRAVDTARGEVLAIKRTPSVVPGQPYWTSLSAPTTPLSYAIAVG